MIDKGLKWKSSYLIRGNLSCRFHALWNVMCAGTKRRLMWSGRLLAYQRQNDKKRTKKVKMDFDTVEI